MYVKKKEKKENPAISKTPKPKRKAETKEKKKKRKEKKGRGESETEKVRDPSRLDRESERVEFVKIRKYIRKFIIKCIMHIT